MSRVIEIIDSDDDNNISDDNPSTSFTSTTHMETEDSLQSQSRRRPRKSALHVLRDSDMQFETIAVEDGNRHDPLISATSLGSQDGDTSSINAMQSTISSRIYPGIRNQVKIPKSAPKILATRPPTNAEIIDGALEEFVNKPDNKNDIYSIALERVRINYLLTLNGMPEINFSLYTQPERLQFQFEERLKQRKMVHNWDASRLQENRRNILQNNIGQDTT